VSPADPAKVVAAARCWLGTPYHDQASVRGIGCDCLGLARGVWREVAGPEPMPMPPYSRDWGETGPREVLAEGARTCMIEMKPADTGPGALLLFRMTPRAIAKHIGILRAGKIKEGSWLARMLARKPRLVVATALANKMARSIWAMLVKEQDYRDPAAAA
jgi:NlpC/P60 family putative phage cell wall peptidase